MLSTGIYPLRIGSCWYKQSFCYRFHNYSTNTIPILNFTVKTNAASAIIEPMYFARYKSTGNEDNDNHADNSTYHSPLTRLVPEVMPSVYYNTECMVLATDNASCITVLFLQSLKKKET